MRTSQLPYIRLIVETEFGTTRTTEGGSGHHLRRSFNPLRASIFGNAVCLLRCDAHGVGARRREYIGSPSSHGDRQWRCESEVVGRILRQQAERKKAFDRVLPILSDGFIRPKTEKRPAGKNRQAIKEAITALQKSLEEEETSFVALQNVIEQACNFFFQQDRFPSSYAELQPVPLLKVGLLTYAGDDGREKGQAYRLALDLDAGVAQFRFRYPDEVGVWQWRQADTIIPLPDAVRERLSDGDLMAPTLREEQRADGERFAVLDFIIE